MLNFRVLPREKERNNSPKVFNIFSMKTVTFFVCAGLFFLIPTFAFAATSIFRSVGPNNTSDLNISTRTVTISGTTATFSGSMPTNVGVGDVLEYPAGAPTDVAFISGRTSDTVYTVQSASGGTPTVAGAGTAVHVHRAYTSLFLAEAGTKNTSITPSFTGGNRNLVTNGEQWNITLYGDDVDTTAVTFNGWTTSSANYIKVYTPVSSSEVGVSQRHNGKWTSGAYKLVVSNATALTTNVPYFWLDGVQINVPAGSDVKPFTIATSPGNVYISNNIIKGNSSDSNSWNSAIAFYGTDIATVGYVWNNIIYDFPGGSSGCIQNVVGPAGTIYIYNNTFQHCATGVWNSSTATYVLKNNIFRNNNYDVSSVTNIDSSSTNNIGGDINLAYMAFGAVADSGTTNSTMANKLVETGQNFTSTIRVGMIVKNGSSYTYITAVDSDSTLSLNNNIMTSGQAYTIYTNKHGNIAFENEAGGDFRLAATDVVAKNAGVDLSADPIWPFSTDIRGLTRTTPWDIGAFSFSIPTASAVSESGTETIGSTLTGAYTYSELAGYAEGVSTFRWLRATTAGGSYSAIGGATAITHVLVSTDIDKYLKFEVTPVSTLATGSAVLSSASGQIQSSGVPTASSVNITGTVTEGLTLTGNYTYAQTDAVAEGVTTFRWLESSTAYGTYSAITGATNSTYTVVTADQGMYIKFEVTPVATIAPTTGVATLSSATAQVPLPIRHTSSGSSVSNRFNNLVAMGNLQAAEELRKQFPNQIISTALAVVPTVPNAQTPLSVTTPLSLTKNHRLSDKGEDIRTLQKWLNDHGFVIALSGAGSPGNETTLFGKLTFKAIVKFQKSKGLPQTGYLGPMTREAILNFK